MQPDEPGCKVINCTEGRDADRSLGYHCECSGVVHDHHEQM